MMLAKIAAFSRHCTGRGERAMEGSRCVVVAAGVLGASWLVASSAAFAQGAAPAAPGPQETREVLGEVIDTRSEGNKAIEASQERIETLSDETDTLLSQYRTALKQIDSLDLYNSQMRDLLSGQEKELGSLQSQLDQVQIVGRSVTPLMILMIDSLEKFVGLDLPFLSDERTQRVAELRKLMTRPDVTAAERFRQITEAYQIESEYGRTIETYRGTLKIDGQESTVDFLRFGRIALVYQSLDGSEAAAWDRDTQKWIPLDGSDRSAIRDALRIARKQAAPDLIRLPLPARIDARSAS
jgi:hypothetical protein